MKAKIDWAAIRASLRDSLSDDDARVLDLLTEGKTTPQIATIVRKHRSWVWRRAQELKRRGTTSPDQN